MSRDVTSNWLLIQNQIQLNRKQRNALTYCKHGHDTHDTHETTQPRVQPQTQAQCHPPMSNTLGLSMTFAVVGLYLARNFGTIKRLL
jgi:hypothetical protein